jgi:hypothetical protein
MGSMTAEYLHARAEMRARWRSWLLLALMVAVSGGAVLALAAGARRTDTAYPRFLRAERAADVQLFVDRGVAAQARRLPEVIDSASSIGLAPTETDFAPVVITDVRYGQELNRFKFLAGRPLNPDRADEAVVNFLVAKGRHLHVGSPLTIHFRTGAASGTNGPGPPPVTQPVTFRVVGIEAAPGEFPPRSSTGDLPVYLSPAFLRTPVGAQAPGTDGAIQAMVVRLRHGARDAAILQADLERLAGTPVGFSVQRDQTANVQRSMHLQAVAVWLMAGFAALATALVLLQLLARQRIEDAVEDSTLKALGMTSDQLRASGMMRVGSMAAAGALGAAIVAVLLSPLLPLGSARVAEPHPGFAFDALALVVGGVGVLLVVSLLGVAALFRTTRTVAGSGTGEELRGRPSSLAKTLPLARLPLVVTTGIRLALEAGRGRAAVPVRATLAAAAIGVGAMAAAVTFGASLGHLLATPGLYGVTFDAHVQTNANFGDIRPVIPALQADPTLEAVAVGFTSAPLKVGAVTFDAQGTTDVQGSLAPTVIEGRLPAAADEILLGSRTMHDVHTGIGQTVQVAVAGVTQPLPMRVVGRGVLAPINDLEQLGHGAIISPAAVSAFGAQAKGFTIPPPGEAFIRFRPGLAKAAARAALQNRLLRTADISVLAPTQPIDVVNFGQVRELPELLAGLLGIVAAVTMAYLLVSSIRRRRRDLAILKTLGFVPRQVSVAIAWQATTVVAVSTAVGLPLGLAAGRAAWAVAAGQVGVVVRPTVPWGVVLGLIPLALLIANLVAAGPALAAGRIRPAAVLRSE